MTWVISGQSNAAGYAPGAPSPTRADVLAWNPKLGVWLPARDPLPFVRVPTGDTRVGAWQTAATAMVRSGRVRSVKLTGAAAASLGIDNWAPGAPLWVELEAAIARSGQRAEVFIWFQGETDALGGNELIRSYGAKLEDLIRRVRTATRNPRMLVIVCGLVDYPEATEGFAAIRRAQRAVVDRDPRAAFVSTEGLPHDGQHLTQQGYQELALKVADSVASRGDLLAPRQP